VVVLVALGLVLIALAVLPGARRPPVFLVLFAAVCALGASALTNDGFLVASAGIVPLLLLLVAHEMAATFDLLGGPRRDVRRARMAERRARVRSREVRTRDRERRRKERQRIAA
jgi:hypothetical protein